MNWEMEQMSVQRKRAGNAAIAVAVLVMAIVAGCVLSSEARAEDTTSTYSGRIWDGLQEGESVADALRETNLKTVSFDEVPDWFSDEVAQPEQNWDIWAMDDWSVIGIKCNSPTGKLQTYTQAELYKNGWSECLSGTEGASTYIKDGGICKWVMVEFAQIGESESMVLRILRN